MRSTTRHGDRGGGVTATRRASRLAAAGAAAALGLGVLGGCAYVDSNPGLEGAPAPGAQDRVTVERILERTQAVDGRTVTVDAEVIETIGGTAATVAGETSGFGPLLVVHEPELELVEGSEVLVTGVVRQTFDLQAVEADLGVDLDDALLSRFAGDPFLMAITIEDAPG